jgi:shikimate kinase
VDSDLIGVSLKMSVENFLETGLRKNLPELPNTTGLVLPEAAKVFSNVTLARRGRKPSRRTGSRLAWSYLQIVTLYLLLGPGYQVIVGSSLMTAETKKEKPLRLALIGMSGAGKTFWTKKLAASGVPAISCDDLIEQKLAQRLAAGGYAGINGVAAWMGWPDNPTYGQREADYLTEEIHTLDEILAELEERREKSLVLDTTGSLIYTGNNLLMRLRRQMTIVYLAASAQEQQLLIERYLSDPKPVLWRGAFQPKPRESPRDTVARCYPALIAARRQSYEALAHCTLQVASLRDGSMDAAAFLKMIHAKIKGAR